MSSGWQSASESHMSKARQDEIEWLPGHYYHLYNRGARRVTIFREEQNYLFTLTRINEYCTAFSLTLIAYVLMPNHYYFLVRQNKEAPAGLLPQPLAGTSTGFPSPRDRVPRACLLALQQLG